MATGVKHTADFGSSIAKGGFDNEHDVVNSFNSWKHDKNAQQCLNLMGYKISEIENVEAFLIHDIMKKEESPESGNPKSDIQVQITIYLKHLTDAQNISIKLVSSESGFNQIDKRWVEKYTKLWQIPEGIEKTLKQFTGQLPASDEGFGIRDPRRMFLNEFTKLKIEELISFIEENKITIVSDILKGRGSYSAEWMLVVWKNGDKEALWTFKSINEVINHYSKGEVKISPRGSLCIGRLTAQRKGGDGGRNSANMLQFKFNPLELF
jgi:hypothetical protein